MIVKLRDEFTTEGWCIISGIKEVSYGFRSKSKLASSIDRHFDSVKVLGEKEEQADFLQMLITFKNGKEEVWVSEVATYLLNDDGKTIERIR